MQVWRTHTVESAMSLFSPSFIFPGFSPRCSLCGKKWGDAHTACPSSHVCCVHWKRVGDVFFFFFSSREIGNPMNTVFPLLWATVLLTTFIYGHLVFLYWKECRWLDWVLQYPSYVQNVFDTWLFHTFYFFSLVNKIEFGICDIVFTLKTKASFFFFFFF